MRTHPIRPGTGPIRTRTLPATLLTVAALTLSAAPGAGAAPAGGDQRTVDYRGYRVQVPAHWPVVDLAADPKACVRFDRSALYLGHPGDQSACPRRITGRRSGLWLQPLDRRALAPLTTTPVNAAPGTATPPTAIDPSWSDGAFELAVPAAGVLATAVHGSTDAQLAHAVLRGATLTDRAHSTTVPARPTPAAPRAVPAQPGTFRGQGFDACAAPSDATMDAWLSSPYRAVGVYTSGPVRACAQPNLTPDWVSRQTGKGWRLIPIHVGPQAPCTGYTRRISLDPATAHAEGVTAADEAAQAAGQLGLAKGSSVYLDIEQYPAGGACSAAVVAHVSGWTRRLHQHGYLSGLYSGGSSGIGDVRTHHGGDQVDLPDQVWLAWWNGKADTDAGRFLAPDQWGAGRRMKQYSGNVTETHGGVGLNIDRNFLDLKAAPVPASGPCRGIRLDFDAYQPLAAGASGHQVRAAQCLLQPKAAPDGRFGPATASAVTAFQTRTGLPASGRLDRPTWTALLSAGATPLLRDGTVGEQVRRLQRALTSSLGRSVAVDGRFGPGTQAAVQDFQRTRGLGADGVVGSRTWQALQAGK